MKNPATWRHVRSSDPRKRAICDALRSAAGLPLGRGRVTNVRENEHECEGHVHLATHVQHVRVAKAGIQFAEVRR